MQTYFQKEVKTPDLFLLITGLSSSEKSYYSKMAKRHANENSALHLKLFQLISQSKTHDEGVLCTKLKIENKIHFSSIKSYLHKDILETLVFLKRNDLVDCQLYFMLEEVKTLLEKRLLSLAQKICDKAINIATQYNKYHLIILLLHLQNQVIEHKNCKEYFTFYINHISKLEKAIHHQHLLYQNKILYEKLKMQKHCSCLPATAEEKCRINKEMQNLKSIKPSGDHQALIFLYYLNSLALSEYMLNEHASCTSTCSRLYTIWKTSPHFIKEESALFLNSLKTTCYNGFMTSEHPIVMNKLRSYKQLAVYLKSEINRSHFEIIHFNIELKFYLKTGNLMQVKNMIDSKRVASLFSTSADSLSPIDELSVSCTICIAFFMLERWDESEALLNVIKDQNKKIRCEDVFYFSSLFLILILFEKKQWDRLYNAIESSYQLLYSHKKPRVFEREMLLFIKRLSSTNSARHSNQLIHKFLAHLKGYKTDADKNLFFLTFDYFGWLESKLLNLRYMDYIVQHTRE